MLRKKELEKYYKSEQIGDGVPVFNIIVGVHGDESAPLLAVDILKKKIAKTKLRKSFCIIHANPVAIKYKKRFVEKDLNASFPGKIKGVYEDRLANSLVSEINNCEFNFDFHTTTFPVSAYGLISRYNEKVKKVLSRIGVYNYLFTDKDSTVKHLNNCIGFEVREENCRKTVLQLVSIMENILIFFGVIDGKLNKTVKTVNIFLIYGMVKKKGNNTLGKMKDFVLVKKGDKIGRSFNGKTIYSEENFFPVWSKNPLFVNKAKKIIIKI